MAESLNTIKKEKGQTSEGKEKLKINVLLADDTEEVRSSTAFFLKMMGCTVEEVENGKQLVERLASARPGEFGLIITDMQMPEMDGLEAIEKIRGNGNFKQLPIILYSAALTPDIEKKVANLGGLSLEKPFPLEELEAKIKEALSKSVQ